MPLQSLTKDEAKTLDDAFVAQLDDDLRDLHSLMINMDGKAPADVASDKMQVAIKVAEILKLNVPGVRNRLYGNGIPVTISKRARFMEAVQRVMTAQFTKLGGIVSLDYGRFVDPVDGDNGSDGDDESDRGVGLGDFSDWMNVRVGAWLADHPNPLHVDNTHHYEMIFRQDLLDYSTDDFYSIRRICGRNVSRRRLPSREAARFR